MLATLEIPNFELMHAVVVS